MVVVTIDWFCNKRILRFHPKKKNIYVYIKRHSVRYWEPDWLIRFTIIFQLNNGRNIWSSLKMQWQLPHLTNDCTVWPWSAKQWLSRAMKNVSYVVSHPRSLISAFIVRCPDSVMSLVSVAKSSSLMLVSVAEQAGLSLTWSETPEDTFSHDGAHVYIF